MKVIFKDMTRLKQNKFDDDVAHVLNNVVTNVSDMTTAFKAAGAYTLIGLFNNLKTEDTRKEFRYKEGDETKGKILDDEDYEELCELRSFYFWLQNSHGTLPRCPIDFQASYTKEMLATFRMLPSSARPGADHVGNVEYDHDIALNNEKVNKIGAFATPPSQSNNQGGNQSNQGGGNPKNNSSQSAEEKELAALRKKVKPSEQSYPKLDTTSQWPKFKSLMEAKFKLGNMGDVLASGYVPPSLQAGDSKEAVELYETKNLHLYTILSEQVTTTAGEGFIRDYPNDGVAIWKKLMHHYEEEQPAKLRKDMLYELVTTTTLPEDCLELHAACLTFENYVATHNKLCPDPDERINEKNKLKYFEKFIRHHSKLIAVKTSLDGVDEIATMNKQVTLTVSARMDFYMQTAIRLDGERKERLIKSNRKANMGFGTLPVDKIMDMDLSAAQALINPGVGYETYAAASDDSNIEAQIAEMDASYDVNAADGGEEDAGRIPHAVWSKMTKEQKSWWIKIPREIRAHILPGTGVSPHHSRATNASFTAPTSSIQGSSANTSPPEGTDRSVSFAGASDSPIIAAMRANSTREPTGGLHSSRRNMNVKNPLDPTRLLSSQNASDAQLRPLPRNNAAHQAASTPHERTVASAIRTAVFPDIPLDGASSHQSGSPPTSTRSAFVAVSTRSQHRHRFNLPFWLSLIDGGANVGLAHPNQLRCINYAYPFRSVNVNGVNGADELEGLRVGTFAGVSRYKDGEEVLLIFHEYGELPATSQGHTIHSKIQIEHDGHRIMDRPHRLGGDQSIRMVPNGEEVPLFFHNGLAYMQTRRPTDHEMNTLPRVIVTSDAPWEPGIYNEMPRIHRRWETVGYDNGAAYAAAYAFNLRDDDSVDDDMPPLMYPDDCSGDDDTSSDGSETNNAVDIVDEHDNDSVPGEVDRPLIVRGDVVPRSLDEALRLDCENGDTAWKDAIGRELHTLFHGNMDRFIFYPHTMTGGSPLLSLAWNFSKKEDGTKKARLVSHHDRRVVSLSHQTEHDQLYLGVLDFDTNRALNGSTRAAVPLMGSRESPFLSITDPNHMIEGRSVEHHLLNQQWNSGAFGQPRTPGENGRNESIIRRSRPHMHREVNHATAHTVYVDNRSVFDRMVRLVDRGANIGVRSDHAEPEVGEDARQRLRNIVQMNADLNQPSLEEGWDLI